jgi:hypothetical protein
MAFGDSPDGAGVLPGINGGYFLWFGDATA